MRCTEILKARVSPQIKRQARAIAERDLLTEAAWLKRLVIREIRACDAANDAAGEAHRENDMRRELIPLVVEPGLGINSSILSRTYRIVPLPTAQFTIARMIRHQDTCSSLCIAL